MLEAFFVANLFVEFNSKKYSCNDDKWKKIYLLEAEWFEKWKAYVNYEYFLSDKKNELFLIFSKLLERIPNQIKIEYNHNDFRGKI